MLPDNLKYYQIPKLIYLCRLTIQKSTSDPFIFKRLQILNVVDIEINPPFLSGIVYKVKSTTDEYITNINKETLCHKIIYTYNEIRLCCAPLCNSHTKSNNLDDIKQCKKCFMCDHDKDCEFNQYLIKRYLVKISSSTELIDP